MISIITAHDNDHHSGMSVSLIGSLDLLAEELAAACAKAYALAENKGEGDAFLQHFGDMYTIFTNADIENKDK